ncbi:MAG: helix-turn-helix transcriptional regulator [Nannocystaceae bacterium]|nr:helix-turn-helix transcriptional regulator [Nannocystaceae bacterium]
MTGLPGATRLREPASVSEFNTAPLATPSFGALLRGWRQRRRFTQLSLAQEAEVSTRHLSYLENGRAKPSREMVAVLSSVLDVPLLHRNEMLLSAGLAPQYPSTELDDSTARHVRSAVEFLLVRHQPYPSMVVDEAWNVVMANDAYVQFACFFRGSQGPPPDAQKVHRGAPVQGSNALLSLFEDDSLRTRIRNLPEFAAMVLTHVRLAARTHAGAKDVEARIRRIVGVLPESNAPFPPVIPLRLDVDGELLSLFSTMTMLGTSADVVLSSMRVETQFPADPRSDALLRRITAGED